MWVYHVPFRGALFFSMDKQRKKTEILEFVFGFLINILKNSPSDVEVKKIPAWPLHHWLFNMRFYC
jgi:hypothetical protein